MAFTIKKMAKKEKKEADYYVARITKYEFYERIGKDDEPLEEGGFKLRYNIDDNLCRGTMLEDKFFILLDNLIQHGLLPKDFEDLSERDQLNLLGSIDFVVFEMEQVGDSKQKFLRYYICGFYVGDDIIPFEASSPLPKLKRK